MAKSTFHASLIASDEFAQYSLRASFFVRRLRSIRLGQAIQEVKELTRFPDGFSWRDRRSWGIEEDVWQSIAEKGISPLLVFCHPRVLAEQPRLLLYYRTVNLVSQKGLAALVGGNIAAIESGRVDNLDKDWLSRVVIALNCVMSALVKNAADIAASDLPGFQFAAVGATIQGSWNNAIGAEGEAAVRSLLVKHLRDEIVQVVWRDGSTIRFGRSQEANVIDHIGDVRVVRLKQGFHIRFGSEPDISMRDPQDVPVIAVEVKAGADPAGALERLGAAIKSFESDRDVNPRVKTVFVVRCMTQELQNRINQGGFFDHTFALSDLLVHENRQRAFANLFLRLILGRQKG